MPFFDIFASPPLPMCTKVMSFFIFFQELPNKKKKINALRPKMTKMASRGPALIKFNKNKACLARARDRVKYGGAVGDHTVLVSRFPNKTASLFLSDYRSNILFLIPTKTFVAYSAGSQRGEGCTLGSSAKRRGRSQTSWETRTAARKGEAESSAESGGKSISWLMITTSIYSIDRCPLKLCMRMLAIRR